MKLHRNQKFAFAIIVLLLASMFLIYIPSVRAAPTIALVSQGATGYAHGQSGIDSGSFNVTLQQTPLSGNLLILSYTQSDDTLTSHITGVVESNVNWNSAYIYAGTYAQIETWWAIPSVNAGINVTITITGGSGSDPSALADVTEWSSTTGWDANCVDKTAHSTDAHTATGNSGTTATTTDDVELLIGNIGGFSASSNATQSNPTDGFTLLDGIHRATRMSSIGVPYLLISSKQTANVSVTFAQTIYWSGTMVTFKTALPPQYPYIQIISNIDSVTDIGTHSNFTAQQTGPNSVNDTLTEANYGGSTSDVFSSGFEESPFTSKWDGTSATTWILGTNSTPGSPWTTHSGTNMSQCGSTNDGTLISDNMDMSTAASIGVSFWYMDDDLDGGTDFEFKAYDGSSYDTIVQLNPATEDVWYQYTWVTTDSQYFDSTFRIQFSATPESGEVAFVDDVTVNMTATNYQLALEEQFTAIPTGYTNREVDVFMGPYSSAEGIYLQGWNSGSSAWVNITSSLTTNQWNNNTVTTIMNAQNTTFAIRFLDAAQSSDTTSSNWQVDATYFYAYNSSGTNYPVALSHSQTTTINNVDVWASLIGLSQAITTSWSQVPKWASLIKPTLAFGTSYDVLSKWSTNINPTQGITAAFNNAVNSGVLISASQSIGTSWNVLSVWASNINLAQSIESSWNSLTSWGANIGLSQSISSVWSALVSFVVGSINYPVALAVAFGTSWNVLSVWATNINLAQSIGSSWNSLTAWTANIDLTQSLSSTWNALSSWVTDINLSTSLSAAWNTVTGWTANINLAHSIGTSWGVLASWAANINLSNTFNFSWSVDSVTSSIHDFFVNLSASIGFSWNVVVDHFGLINDSAIEEYLALAIIGIVVAVVVAFTLFKVRGHDNE